MQNEIKSIRVAYEKRTKECDHLKEMNSQLKKQIKGLKKGENERIFKFTATEKELQIEPLASEREITNHLIDSKEDTKNRWIRTQQTKRRVQIGKSVDFTNISK